MDYYNVKPNSRKENFNYRDSRAFTNYTRNIDTGNATERKMRGSNLRNSHFT